MRADVSVANGDTPLTALMRETAAATVDTVLAELRRRPIVHPEWLSLQDAAAYTGYSEQQFSEFVKRGIAPKNVLFSRNARRFKRSDLDAWCAAGGPSQFEKKEGEQHLRNLGVTAPADLPLAELARFTDRVLWLVRQSGIKDPAAWLANLARVEATVAPLAPVEPEAPVEIAGTTKETRNRGDDHGQACGSS